MAIDPVCGMKVDEKTTKLSHVHKGSTYYFCSQRCLDLFRKDPTRYLTK
ncbi:MAG: YHS domain-containing protein [Thaumarchaeota archaeon]|nr:YHS domain-containing protein [Candidatus Calditenuaceae archaeon]MDW8186672.1 YHS domain-containing protein [Nitrososphaerota archaeon]